MHATAFLKSVGLDLGQMGVWLPGEVVFSAGSGDSQSLWSVGLSKDGTTVTGPARRLTAGTGLDQSPAVAPGHDGKRLYFASLDRRVNLYRLPVAANEGRALGDPQPLTDTAAGDVWPSVSADGRRLVFLSNRQSSLDLWLKDLGTLQETPLGPVEGFQANISPDGQRVVFQADVNGKHRFVVRPVNGGEATPVAPDIQLVWDWPAASWLVTGGEGAASWNTLEALDLATGTLRPLLSGDPGQTYGHAHLSPDGRWMSAMEWSSGERARVIVFPFRDAPAPPADRIAVSDEDSVAEENAWSPDGQLLYFVSERDGSRCLWARRLDPRTKHPIGLQFAVLHLHGSRRSMVSTQRSPERFALGRDEIIFSMELQRGNIWNVTLKEP